MVTKPAFPGICAFPLTGNSERSQLSGWDIFKNFTPKNLWVRAVKSFLLSLFFCLYWVILLWSGQFYTINYVERQLSLSPYLFVRPAGEAHRHAGKGEGAGLHSVKKKPNYCLTWEISITESQLRGRADVKSLEPNTVEIIPFWSILLIMVPSTK